MLGVQGMCIMYLFSRKINTVSTFPAMLYSLPLYVLRFMLYALSLRVSFGDPIGLDIMFEIQQVGVTKFHFI